MKILLIHCHYRLPGGEDAVFAAERALLEQHGHTVVVYERSNEEAAHGVAKALLPFRAVWNRRAARDVRNIIEQQHIDAVIHNTLLLLSPAVVRAAKKCGVPVVLTSTTSACSARTASYCRTDGSVRTARTTACTAHCGTAATATAGRRRSSSWPPTGIGCWAHMARHCHPHHPTEFDREKLLEFI